MTSLPSTLDLINLLLDPCMNWLRVADDDEQNVDHQSQSHNRSVDQVMDAANGADQNADGQCDNPDAENHAPPTCCILELWSPRVSDHCSVSSSSINEQYIMSRAKTINLTRASEGNYLEEVLNIRFQYDENIAERCAVKRQYFEQRQLVEEIFQDKFRKLNECILKELDKFVEKCLDTGGDHLFVGEEAESIFGSILHLDMQISDHEPTFKLIETSLKKYKNLNVIRVKVGSIRKRNLMEILEPCRHSKRVFIMIEQAETMSRATTDLLVGHLRNRIEDPLSPTSVVMVLFCLSTHIQELPFDHVNCFGRMATIEKDKKSENEEVKEQLVRSRGLRMKLSHEPLDFIYEYFVNVDASLAGVVYMLNHALFEFYIDLEDIYGSMSKTNLVEFEKTVTLKDQHQHLCDQLYYLVELLKEKDLYPSDITDLYEDCSDYQKLSHSTRFYDSLRSLNKFSQEALLRRIDAVIKKSQQISPTKNGKTDVISIVTKYRDKILNNKDCDHLKTELINELSGYAETLTNPIKLDKGLIYFKNLERLQESTLTAVRHEDYFMKCFNRNETYFSILLRHILNSPGHIGVHDLATDVADEYRDLIRSERSRAIKKGPRTKFTPRKRGNGRVSQAPHRDNETAAKALSADEEEGLIKALFVDAIDCMEQQCLIKLDPRNRGKQLKRLVWPSIGKK